MTCMGEAMAEIELSAGSIRYEDSGGQGPVVVLCHGPLMAASLWDEVVEELGSGVRCVRPTLPLGAHRRPMRPEADLSLRGPRVRPSTTTRPACPAASPPWPPACPAAWLPC
jgi:pimeloyl-ACP methyl ester carboxylesterase